MASDQVSFLHSTGGLLSEAVLSELRNDRPTGPATKLDDPSTFLTVDGSAPTRAVHEEDLELAFKTAEATWGVLSDSLDDLDTSRLRDRLLLPLLRLLGFDPQFQKAHLEAGRERYAISHLGWEGEDAPPLLLAAGDLDARVGKRTPHQELQSFLNDTHLRWGIVANAREVRVLRDFHHTTVQGAVIIDLADLLEAGSFADFRAMYRLGHASRFLPPPGDEGGHLFDQVLIEQVYQDSLSEGVAVGKALQPQVRRAFTSLLNGILEGDAVLRQHLVDEPLFGRVMYRELLVMLYRVLFVLFAEQRGLLDGANDIYADSYSVTRLRKVAETRTPEPRRGDLWEGLKAVFGAFAGDENMAAALGVYPYNGQLFDPANTRHINEATCTNRHLLDAIRALTTVQLGGVRQYVDFRHLGVEELGTVYESLLAYTIRIASEPIDVEGIAIHAGQGYLAPLSLERSELGAYYTPSKLVDLTLSTALDELIADRLEGASTVADQEAALLNLQIIDPACGSAAFLVGAIDRVAAAIADARSGDHQPNDWDVAHARRDVLQHCIYGVDVDPFAAELAKVALWIHCAVDDMPLTFLDHKIICGNSLVGWPMFDLPKEIPDAAYDVPSGLSGNKNAPIRGQYRAARDLNREYLSQFDDPSGGSGLELEFAPKPQIDLEFPDELMVDDRTVGDVGRKAEALGRYRASHEYKRAKLAADTWTAAFFWSPDLGAFPTSKEYHSALAGGYHSMSKGFQSLMPDLNPLHWCVEFPEVHSRGGFDLVVGNPPWERFQANEEEFFGASLRPDIARLTGNARKAAIAALADGSSEEKELLRSWPMHQNSLGRLTNWIRDSGRFTRTGGKANTFVSFAELGRHLMGDVGRGSLLVKSAIAVDKSQMAVWHEFVDAGAVRSLTDIVNNGLFPTVTNLERFSILELSQPRPIDSEIEITMMCSDLEEAAVRAPLTVRREDLWVATPETGTLLSVTRKDHLELCLAMHRRNPILGVENRDGPWEARLVELFNATTASRLFLKKTDLVERGWTLGRDRVFRGEGGTALPLLEGQLVDRFDHRARSYQNFSGLNPYVRHPKVPLTSDGDKRDPAFEVETRYWMMSEPALSRIDEVVGDLALIAIRRIANKTDPRTTKAALVPCYPATNSLPILAVDRSRACELLAIVNSTAFDFAARLHLPGPNLGMKWVMSQIPVPQPGCEFEIGALAQSLSITSEALAKQYELPIAAWDPTRRANDEARLDALVAKTAYRLDRVDYEMVLNSFDVLRRSEELEHGEYRFKRLCLEAYDRL